MNLEVRILKSLKQLKNFDSKNDIVKKRWNKISKIKKTFIIKYLMWNRCDKEYKKKNYWVYIKNYKRVEIR